MIIRRCILPTSFLLLLATSCTAWSQSGGSYVIRKSTIDAGGGSSSGGTLVLRGTIGQADASVQASAGGAYAIHGGFWAELHQGSTATSVFADGFEAPPKSANAQSQTM